MHSRFRLYRSVGYGYVSSALYAVRMRAVASLLVLSTACTTPTAATPTPTPATPTPATPTTPVVPATQEVIHDNIPFSVVGHEDVVLWLCTTQPRTYTTRDGAVESERDHYAQPTPCPTTPVP